MRNRVTLDFDFNFQRKHPFLFVVLLAILREIYEGKLCMEVGHYEETKTGIASRIRGLKNTEKQRVNWMASKDICPGNELRSVNLEALRKSCNVYCS